MFTNHSLLLLILFLSSTVAANWATYPSVPKTASINGFADPIYSLLPECARSCVEFSTGNTPCPYWDTGCFCVMPQWSGLVANCIAEKCQGDDVVSAASLATSLCSKVGANTWMMPASISTALSKAAGNAKAISATATSNVSTVSGGTSANFAQPASTETSTSSNTDIVSSTGIPSSSSTASMRNQATYGIQLSVSAILVSFLLAVIDI